ncbi:MAG TPA: hypothetical protein VG345_07630 [Bryobacteraceae bacterium]|jgi:hypothetical protein|nr:hypothetical protein [Bryobacteraceae bacterium]
MILTKDELISSLENDVQILSHLISKVEPGMLDYRPTPKQRSMLELLQYLVIVGPVQLRTIQSGTFDMDSFSKRWQAEDAKAKGMGLAEAADAIGKQLSLIREVVNSLSDSDLREEMEMFGSKGTRGAWLVNMAHSHYVAYRMQLFLYLKSCGREELSTMDLWAGRSAQ